MGFDSVQAAMVSDAEEPGLERRPVVEAVEVLVGLEEHRLMSILCHLRLPKHRPAIAIQRTTVRAHEEGKGSIAVPAGQGRLSLLFEVGAGGLAGMVRRGWQLTHERDP